MSEAWASTLNASAGADFPAAYEQAVSVGESFSTWRVTCAAGADGWEVTLFRDRLPLVTRVGDGRWAQSRWRVTGEGPEIDIPVVAAGGWRDADTFVAEVLLIETPHRIMIELDRRTGLADLRWRLFPLMGADPLALAVRPIGSVGPTVDKV